MVLDPQHSSAGAMSAAADDTGKAAPPDVARPATTASMQSLLAQYFETQPFDPVRVHALGAPPPESRTPEHGESSPSAAQTANTRLPLAAGNEAEWPSSAKALIDTLTAENARLRAELRAQTEALHTAMSQADSDVLTPTLNRRAFLREMHRAMADCRRYGEQACLIYLDMDGFKGINDTYGHAAGDAALIYVAETLKGSVREGDSVGRIGGDEFAILLRRADLNSSRIKALKLEAELALGTFEHNGLYLKTGGSFGVRAFANQTSAEVWLSEADAAMFLVKKSSR